MEIIIVFLLLVSLVAVITYALIWRAATGYMRNYLGKYQGYLKDIETLAKLKKMLLDESWYWPIRIRPVLYMDIDRVAQIQFANAHKALNDAEIYQSDIRPLSEITAPATLFKRLTYYRHVIAFCRLMNRYIRLQRENLKTTQTSLKHLRSAHKKIDDLKQEAKQKIIRLRAEIDSIKMKIETVKQFPAIYNRLLWSLEGAETCLRFGEEQLAQAARVEANDGIEYAISDTLSNTAEYFLEYFSICYHAYQYNERFDLNRVENTLTLAKRILQPTLSLEAMDNWRGLFITRRKYDALQKLFAFAKTSLDQFEIDFHALTALETKLQHLQSQNNIDQVDKIERDCVEFWDPFSEGYKAWKEYLKGRKLPSERLSLCRVYYDSYIKEYEENRKAIRQDLLPDLNKSMESFIRNFESINEDIQQLQIGYLEYLHAFNLANQSTSNNGEASKLLLDLETIVPDTTPDIKACIQSLKDQFEKYRYQIGIKRKIDFPAMLVSIHDFCEKSKSLRTQHDQILMQLKQTIQSQWLSANNQKTALETEIDLKPRVEITCSDLLREIILLTENFPADSKKFDELNTYSIRAADAISETKKKILIFREERRKYTYSYERTGKRIQSLKSQIDSGVNVIKQKWPKVLIAIADEVEETKQQLENIHKQWRDAALANTINDGYRICQDLDSETENIRRNTLIRLKEAESRANAMSAKWSFSSSEARKIAPVTEDAIKFKEEVLSCLRLAEDEDDLDVAWEYLCKASQKLASGPPRAPMLIEKLINTRNYIEGDVNTNGGDFIGNDSYRFRERD